MFIKTLRNIYNMDDVSMIKLVSEHIVDGNPAISIFLKDGSICSTSYADYEEARKAFEMVSDKIANGDRVIVLRGEDD